MCTSILDHLRRTTTWRLATIEPSNKEAELLNKSNVRGVLQSYLVWRRSSMLLSFIIMSYASGGGYVTFQRFLDESEYVEEELQDFVGILGHMFVLLPFIADVVLSIGLFGAFATWNKWHWTTKVIKYSWLVSTVMPLIPAVVPFSFIASSTFKDDFLQKCNEEQTVYFNQGNTFNQNGLQPSYCEMAFQEVLLVGQMSAAFSYGITILPLILTFPSSCVRAALRVRGLVPDWPFSSWMISIAAPFQSMLTLVSCIFLIQMAGNAALVSAALLMFLVPWFYVANRNLYVSIRSDEKEKKIDKLQHQMFFFWVVAVIFIVVWAHMATIFGRPVIGVHEPEPVYSYSYDEEENRQPWMTYLYFSQLVFESFGRLLATTVVFGDAILCMTVENFHHSHSRIVDESTWERINNIFEPLESGIH